MKKRLGITAGNKDGRGKVMNCDRMVEGQRISIRSGGVASDAA